MKTSWVKKVREGRKTLYHAPLNLIIRINFSFVDCVMFSVLFADDDRHRWSDSTTADICGQILCLGWSLILVFVFYLGMSSMINMDSKLWV
jgi:hypothetical protein